MMATDITRQLLVLYGSQTGTAHDVADRVVRDAKRRHFSSRAVPMDAYNITNLINEPLIVFVCSTTGQGDTPDNMKTFWKFLLRKDLPASSLESVQFAVLGLGDSSYQKFNVVGKKLQKRLEQLGAKSIVTLGLADDQHDLGVDAVVGPWLSEFWSRAMQRYPLPPDLEVISESVCPPPKYKVVFIEKNSSQSSELSNETPANKTSPHEPGPLCPFHARLISNRRLTASDHFQDTRLIKLDISGSGINYSPGDVAMIQPDNMTATVDAFIELLDLDPEQLFTLQENDPDVPLPSCLPTPCSVRHLVTKYLDINAVPRRSFFQMLKYHAKDEMEREKLEEFCSPEGQDELYSYCNRVRRTILEILQDFSKVSVNIPFTYLFDLIPAIQPRAFSIASSPKAHPDQIQLLMAVVTYRTKLHLPRRGVCSTWLASLQPDTDTSTHDLTAGDTSSRHQAAVCPRIPVWVKRGTIEFPQSHDVPMVLVGPGTGLAPFRSLIHERAAQSKGDVDLFFGCRSKTKDFYCEDEFSPLVEKGFLRLHTAFSRDQEDKIYVQHRLREQGQQVWDCLGKRNGYFYIAGNAKSMPDDVKEALWDVVSTHGDMTLDQAKLFVTKMERDRRFQVEAWS